VALHGGDADEVCPAEPGERLLEAGDAVLGCRVASELSQQGELAAVEARAERRSLSLDEDDPDRAGQGAACFREGVPQLRVLRVAGARAGQREGGALAVDDEREGVQAFFLRVAPPRPRSLAPDSLRMRCTNP
jgi:hypothetical protein